MNNDFATRRTLQHQLVSLWRECFGKDWVEIIGGDNFYFPNPLKSEQAIRQNLIERSANELDSMILSTKLQMEVANGQ